MKRAHESFSAPRTGGFALFTALILLLAITVIALVAMKYVVNQIHVASNDANAQISFETGEGTLRVGESGLLAGTYSIFYLNGNGLYTFDPTQAPLWNTLDWNSSAVLGSGFSGQSSAPGKFIIEQMPSVARPGQSASSVQYGGGIPPVRVYRVTARSAGANGNAAVLLQSIFHD